MPMTFSHFVKMLLHALALELFVGAEARRIVAEQKDTRAVPGLQRRFDVALAHAGAVEFGTKRGRKTVNIVPVGVEA